MPLKKIYCQKYNQEVLNGTQKKYGFISGVLLVILPKCPFCIMAYSSTVVLCSKDMLLETQYHNNSLLTIFITTFFCSLIIVGLLLNFRGTRTKYALTLSSLGILIILNSVIRNGGQNLYYLGVSIIFIAIWLNGSLISILRKFNNTLNISKRNGAGSP
jgi:hypothetical protein